MIDVSSALLFLLMEFLLIYYYISLILRPNAIFWKKRHNSGHQRVVAGIVAFLFFVFSYFTLSVLFWLFQVNKDIVMLHFSIPSLVSLSIYHSLLLLFLILLLLPV